MKHVILLLVNTNDEKLIKSIMSDFNNDPEIYFLIHIDIKWGVSQEFCETLKNNKQILECYSRFNCERFSYEMFIAMLDMLRKARKILPEADYYHYMSESCIMFRNVEHFKEFFVQNEGKSFMYHYIFGQIKDMVVHKGYQWKTFHNGVVEELLNKIIKDKNNLEKEKSIVYFLKTTRYAPDEIEFETLLLNFLSEETKQTIENHSLTFVKWGNTGGHPFYLTKENYEEIINSDCLFARKIKRDSELYEKFKKR